MSSEKVVRRISAWAGGLALVFIFLRGLVNKKWRSSLEERCVGGAWLEQSWHEQEVIWFHGASVGEVAGLTPLLQEFRRQNPDAYLLVSTTSVTGREEVKRRVLADNAFLFPLDHTVYARRALELVKPKLVVLSETELWPNFLFAAKDLGIPVMLINGRISSYSFPRYHRLRFLFRPLLQSLRKILVQTQLDAERFMALGASESQVQIAGSTKYSSQQVQMTAEEKSKIRELFGIDAEKPCFVAGSVRAGEDEQVVRAYFKVREQIPSLQFIVAPRHAERFAKVKHLLELQGVPFTTRSEILGRAPSSTSARILLLDTIGELSRAYALGSFAFVGGSLVDIGGHNPFEPAAYRSPVLIGPFCSNVKEAVDELETKGGLFIVRDEDELVKAIVRLAQNPDECLARGARAYEVWKRNAGAVEKVLPVIQEFLVRRTADTHFEKLSGAA